MKISSKDKIKVTDLLSENNVLVKGEIKKLSKISIFVDDIETNFLYDKSKENRIFIMTSANNFLEKASKKIFDENLQKIKLSTLGKNSILIITKDCKSNKIVEQSRKYFSFIIESNLRYIEFLQNAREIFFDVNYQLLYHASFVSVFGEGVLLRGKPGIGKSELLMSLVKQKHLFIADDAVDIRFDGNKLIGKPSSVLQDFAEIRGIGIVNVDLILGSQHIISDHKIDYIIELVEGDVVEKNMNRLMKNEDYEDILGVKIKKITLYVGNNKNLTDLVELAISSEKAIKHKGYDSLDVFKKNINKKLKKNG